MHENCLILYVYALHITLNKIKKEMAFPCKEIPHVLIIICQLSIICISPPDYRHTDKIYGLMFVLLASNLRVIGLSCTQQAEPLISTAMRHTFDLDL